MYIIQMNSCRACVVLQCVEWYVGVSRGVKQSAGHVLRPFLALARQRARCITACVCRLAGGADAGAAGWLRGARRPAGGPRGGFCSVEIA